MKKYILLFLLTSNCLGLELNDSHKFELVTSGFGISMAGARAMDALGDAEKCPAIKDVDFFLPLTYLVICYGLRADGPPETAEYRKKEFGCDALGIGLGYVTNKLLTIRW